MRLDRIRFVSVAGVVGPLELEFGPALNVVVGGNGAGKSTLAMLVRDSIWPPAAGIRGEADLFWTMGVGTPQERRVEHALRRSGDPMPLAGARPDLSRCYIQRVGELLAEMRATDVATAVRREIAGGSDPSALRSAPITLDGRRKEARDWLLGEQALRRVESDQRAIAEQERQLTDLCERRTQAVAAGERLPRLRARLRWLAIDRQVARLRRRTAAILAPAVALDGDELETVRALRASLLDAESEQQAVKREHERVQAEIRALGIGEVPLAERVIVSAGDFCDRLTHSQLVAAQTRRELAAAQATLGALGVAPADRDAAALGAAALRRLVPLVDLEARAQARCEALSEHLRRLPRADVEVPSQVLRDGIKALTSWLSAADTEAILKRLVAPRSLVLGLVAVGLAASVAAELSGGHWGHPYWVGLAGVGVGLWLADWWRPRALPRPTTRQSSRAEFQSLALRSPRSWTAQAVRTRVHDLHQSLAATRLAERARSRARRLAVDLETARAALAAARARRSVAIDRLGLDFDEQLPLANLVHFDRLVHRRQAQAAVAGLRGRLAAVEGEAAALGGALDEILVAAGRPALSASETARAAVDELARLNGRLQTVGVEMSVCECRQRQVEAEIGRLRHDLSVVFERCELPLDDDQGLVGLLELRDEGLRLAAARRELEREIDRLRVEVGDDAVILAVSCAELESAVTAAATRHAELATLSEAIGRIRNQVATVTSGCALADALAARDLARHQVVACRDAALRQVVRDFLIDLVEREFDNSQRPRCLELAAAHFAGFTQQRWGLEFCSRSQVFWAREVATGRRHDLAELSDGTRVQLLIAARLGFVESQERGVALPLFFDEALSTADPQRFAAVVRALVALAQNGRQVFYLTANPADVSVVQELVRELQVDGVQVCDLDAARAVAVEIPAGLITAVASEDAKAERAAEA